MPENAGDDSFSQLPLFRGVDQPIRAHAVNTACNGLPSVRQGPWKLVFQRDPAANTDLQLYNLDTDLGETKNVAAENPTLVAEMRALLERLIANGRSTPGPVQRNDVRVRRFPLPDVPAAPKTTQPKKAD